MSSAPFPPDGPADEEVQPELEDLPPFRLVNVPFVVLLCLATIGLAAGIRKLHDRQMDRMPGLLLKRSREAQADGDLHRAATSLERYVDLVPADVEAASELASLLYQTADSPERLANAMRVMDDVLRQDPQRHTLRHQLIDAAVSLGRHADAAAHSKQLLVASPASSELWVRLADVQRTAGQWWEAAGADHMAIRLSPERIDIYARLADLLDRQLDQPQAADAVLARMLAANPDSPAARSALEQYDRNRGLTPGTEQGSSTALRIVPRSTYAAYREAVQSFEERFHAQGDAIEWKRTAEELAARPGRKARQEAIVILEQLRQRRLITPAEESLLARLYVAHGDWPRGRAMLLQVLSAAEPQADDLAFAVGTFLDHGESGAEVAGWLEGLRRLEADGFRRVVLESRMLIARGQWEQAFALLDEACRSGDAASDRLGQAAALLAAEGKKMQRAGQTATAEALLVKAERFIRESVAARPERLVELIGFLADRQRVDEAWELFDEAWEQCPPIRVAESAVRLFEPGRLSSEQSEALWKQLSQAAAGQSHGLLLQMAHAAHTQGDYETAMPLYRAAIDADPHAAEAYKQLAFLLAFHHQNLREAQRLMNRAIVLLGPAAELLQMRGVVETRRGNLYEALQDLQIAIAEDATAEMSFQLSQVHAKAGDAIGALAAFQWALAEGLQIDRVHPLQRQAFAELEARLGALDVTGARPPQAE